jgi:two-component system cell cycle response regulator DivK
MAGIMKEKILLIEDNEHNRYLLTFLLTQHGYEVVVAESGPEGIAVASTMEPSLVLLDIQLPGMDGYAVARELRQQKALANTVVVAVTSYAMPGDREKALEAGCTGYIEKPIDPETFVPEMERIAKTARGTT